MSPTLNIKQNVPNIWTSRNAKYCCGYQLQFSQNSSKKCAEMQTYVQRKMKIMSWIINSFAVLSWEKKLHSKQSIWLTLLSAIWSTHWTVNASFLLQHFTDSLTTWLTIENCWQDLCCLQNLFLLQKILSWMQGSLYYSVKIIFVAF